MTINPAAIEAAKRIVTQRLGTPTNWKDADTVTRALIAAVDHYPCLDCDSAARAKDELAALRQAVREVITRLEQEHETMGKESEYGQESAYGHALDLLREKTAPHMGGAKQ